MIMHIEVKFSFSLRFQELLDPNRVLRRLLDDEIHRALSLFVRHWFLRFAVSAFSYDVDQRIESSIRMSLTLGERCQCVGKSCKALFEPLVHLADVSPRAPAS